MTEKNVVTIDYGSNPKLAALFKDKKPGDRCKIELGVVLTTNDEKQLVGTIDEVHAGEPEPDKNDIEEVTDKPLRMDMAIGPSVDTTVDY